MEREEIFSKLNEIFEEILDLEETPNLSDSTTGNDIDEWDSLSQIQLIVAIEKQFNIKFNSKEIIEWKNVGDMVDSIISKWLHILRVMSLAGAFFMFLYP